VRIAATALVLAVAMLAPLPTRAADITMAHSAIERLIWNVLLTDGGRAYLEGTSTEECRYAFIQEPRVSGLDGRLNVRFLFSGLAAAGVAGRCVGPGDTFDIVVSGVPALAAGVLYFRDLRVEAPDTAYFRLVRSLVERELNARMRYPIQQDLSHVAATLAAPRGYSLSVDGMQLEGIEIDEEAVHLSLEFSLGFR